MKPAVKLAQNVTADRTYGWCSLCHRGKRRAVAVVMLVGKTKVRDWENKTRVHETRFGICLRCMRAVWELAL
jgi:hypothetical protein